MDGKYAMDLLMGAMAEGMDRGGVQISPPAMLEIRTQLDYRVPKQPLHFHEENAEHDWETDANGEIDFWAWEDIASLHHGPACRKCGYSFCEQCRPDGWNDEPCIVDYDQCPTCRGNIGHGAPFCHACGQALAWPGGGEKA